MKAVVYTRYGGPEVLEIKDIEKPVPKDNEVLIKVIAVAVNDWDWGLLQGTPKFMRIFSGLRRPTTPILGSDVAGIVEATGKSITKFRAGDEVYGDLSGTWGGLAEYVCARENTLALKPAGMSFIQAAAIPQAAMLAVQGLIDRGEIRQGQKLLINGAGGGVGTFGLAIAKTYGVEVTGVDNPLKLEMMLSLGFDHVIDYTREDFTSSGKQYDLILDAKTNRPMRNYLRALNPGGAYVTVGGNMDKILEALLLGPILQALTKKKIRIVALKANKDLDYMNELFNSGRMTPVIDGPYPLDQVREAFARFGKGEHKGKIVITI